MVQELTLSLFYVAITQSKDQPYIISLSIRQTYKGAQTVMVPQSIAKLDLKVYKYSPVDFKSFKIGMKGSLQLFKKASDL